MKNKYQFAQKETKRVDKRLLFSIFERLYQWNED